MKIKDVLHRKPKEKTYILSGRVPKEMFDFVRRHKINTGLLLENAIKDIKKGMKT